MGFDQIIEISTYETPSLSTDHMWYFKCDIDPYFHFLDTSIKNIIKKVTPCKDKCLSFIVDRAKESNHKIKNKNVFEVVFGHSLRGNIVL